MDTTKQNDKSSMAHSEGHPLYRSVSDNRSSRTGRPVPESPEILNGLMKSASIGSTTSGYCSSSCSSCDSSDMPVPALTIQESPQATRPKPTAARPALSPATTTRLALTPDGRQRSASTGANGENQYRTFLREATKAHNRRSLDMKQEIPPTENFSADPYRLFLSTAKRGALPQDSQKDSSHKHTHHHHHHHHRHGDSARSVPRASSVQSDSGVDRLRRKTSTPTSISPPSRRKLLDRGNTCVCQTPEANAPPGPSPGPGAYEIDDVFSASNRAFTISPAPRLLHSRTDSPGPGHYSPSPTPRVNSPAFTISSPSTVAPTKKTLFSVTTDTPGPGSYELPQIPVSPRLPKSPPLPSASPKPPASPYSPPRSFQRRLSLSDVKPKSLDSPPMPEESAKSPVRTLLSRPPTQYPYQK